MSEIQPSQPALPPKKKIPIWIILVPLFALILIAAGAAWYYYEGPCGVSMVQRTFQQIDKIAGHWDDTNTLANSTPRMSLAGPIAELQSTRRELLDLAIPACMEKTRNYLADSMDFTIKGYLAFAAQDTESAVNTAFSSARVKRSSYIDAVLYVTKCAPFCQ